MCGQMPLLAILIVFHSWTEPCRYEAASHRDAARRTSHLSVLQGSNMRRESPRSLRVLKMQARHLNGVAKARTRKGGRPSGKRMRGTQRDVEAAFSPPEDWHEPCNSRDDYKVIVQPAGAGYRHILTPEDVRQRLSLLPASFTAGLDVVQMSSMTTKKRSFPCYGMQWGTAIYLYPVEESLIEVFNYPPLPNLLNEVKMYGGQWEHDDPGPWNLVWSEETIRDFYLNNILIHELGHLLDRRNTSYVDRERYAEWFATEYGYRRTSRKPQGKQTRRHHAKR
jgi:hypothetical protein